MKHAFFRPASPPGRGGGGEGADDARMCRILNSLFSVDVSRKCGGRKLNVPASETTKTGVHDPM